MPNKLRRPYFLAHDPYGKTRPMLMKIFDYTKQRFLAFDRRLESELRFFFRHWGKSKFMIAMSKKAQVLGLEKLYAKGPKAFFYFFMFYLIRDTILYIIIPIYFAKFLE